jgi:hypothetical protein
LRFINLPKFSFSPSIFEVFIKPEILIPFLGKTSYLINEFTNYQDYRANKNIILYLLLFGDSFQIGLLNLIIYILLKL